MNSCSARRLSLPLVLAALFLAGGAGTAGAVVVLEDRGFQPNRDYFNQLPFEHVDPVSGNLLLTFTDLVLPGNAGFDLRIQRTYNSKIYVDYPNNQGLREDSWAGQGWSMHLGRILHYDANDGAPPVVEMPDGSRHPMYKDLSGGTKYISKEYWVYDKAAQSGAHFLKLPDGRVYKFGNRTGQVDGAPVVYVDQISDPFGNTITINYNTGASMPPDAMMSVVQDLGGGQVRTVNFTTTDATLKYLSAMTYTGSKTYTWTYAQTRPSGLDIDKTLLTGVTPPVGAGWIYGYNTSTNPKWELTSLTTPYGGTITYTYADFSTYLGDSILRTFHGVSSRVVAGRDAPDGCTPQSPCTRTFQYAQGTNKNQTVITAPASCGTIVTTFTFKGLGEQGTTVSAAWQVGLMVQKTISDGGATPLQTEDFTWRTPLAADAISNDQQIVGPWHDSVTYVPLLAQKKVTRNGRVYKADYTYRTGAGLFNDYGKPDTITETGDLTRTTTRTFDYSFGTLYIKDRIATEKVTDGTEDFVKSYSYLDANGFKDSETIFGRPTTYAPSGSPTRGNVGTVTDASSHATSLTYSWGVVKNITPPEAGTGTVRTINAEGTVADETRGGFTTTFTYDDRFRVKTVTPPLMTPAANPITTTYFEPASGTPYVKVTRGNTFLQTDLDGFGRPSATLNAVNVNTDIRYDACDRRRYESYPFASSGVGSANIGVLATFDALDRTLSRANPDASTITYTYTNGSPNEAAIDVAIKNERNKTTHQRLKAFGDPDETRLASVLDADGKTWRYTYNVLGSLLTVTSPLGAGRQSTYFSNAAGQAPYQGLLKSETHPEGGTIQYTYALDGTLATRSDPAFGSSAYTNDGNHRMTFINRQPAYDTYDTHFEYDGRNNRTRAYNLLVDSHFAFDAAGRLTSRTDALHGKTYATTYTPDPNDNIQSIDYPSPSTLHLAYAYDAANRITAVSKVGTTCAAAATCASTSPAPGAGCFARSFGYFPSGAPLCFQTGNSLAQSFTYDPNRYWLTSLNSGGQLNLNYDSIDAVGNVLSIKDVGRPAFNQTLTYDNLDRLTGASGVWGAGAFTYDELGNRKTKKIGAAAQVTYTNDTGATGTNHLLTSSAPESDSFFYDLNGNLSSQNLKSYTYTPDNLVATATVSGAQSTYEYDADGMRTYRSSAGKNHTYVHGLGGQILAEYVEVCPGQVQVARNYIYAGTRLIASDRPSAGLIAVKLSAPTVSFAENQGGCPNNTSCPVTLNAQLVLSPTVDPLPCAVTVTYATGGAGDTAAAGVDYTPVSGQVTFNAGAHNGELKPIPVPVLNDTLYEDNETFTLRISGEAVGDTPSEVVTITNDDAPPVVSVNNCTVGEGNSGLTPCPFVISLNTASGKAVTVTAATANGTADGGDYEAIGPTPVTLDPGVTSKPFPVNVKGDDVDEPNQTFTLNLTNPVNATPGTMQGTGTIQDDDPQPTMSITSVSVTDRNPGTSATLAVSLSNYSEFPITANHATVAGTATSGVDYIQTSGALSFLPGHVPVAGETKKYVTVPIVQDAVEESAETFQVQISGVTGATPPAGPATVTIVERGGTLPLFCAPPLQPQNDGTNLPPGGVPDLVISEIAPGSHIELYNSTSAPIALNAVSHQLKSEPLSVALNALGAGVVVPAHGYATVPWPTPPTFPAFTDTAAGGEIVLFKNNTFSDPLNMLDFVCWGTNPHGTLKPQAETIAHKWSGACAPALSAPPPPTASAISRKVKTPGTVAADYDTVAGASPMNCVGTFNVTKIADTYDGVCDAADCSLREAIDAANHAPGPDVVRVPKGTYALTNVGNAEDGGLFGDLDVTEDLRLAGQGAVSTVIDASSIVPEQGDRALDVRPNVTAIVSGLTLRGGFPQGFKDQTGGCLRNQGTLTLRDVSITGGSSLAGGGIYSSGPGLALTGVTVSGNASQNDGGGIYVLCAGCTASIVDSTLSGNAAANRGGGLMVDGGAVVQVSNSTISNNTSDSDHNSAGFGGGVLGLNATVRFRNSIVAANVDNTGLAPDCSIGTIVSEQYNLIGNNTGCFFPATASDIVGVSPLLAALANNRGPTQTHALQTGSPAIDSANPGAPGSGGFTCEVRDQRGYVRPENPPTPPAICDRGSFELCDPVYGDMGTNFAYPFAKDLTCRAITSGCGGGNYCPTNALLRQEMAVFLIQSMGEQPSGVPSNAYFSDLGTNNPYAGFINRLFELKITGGCAAGVFCPTAHVTREQMAVFLISALEEKPSTTPTDYFNDIAASPYRQFINRLFELNIAGGCGGGAFCPTADLTRDTMTVWTYVAFFGF